MLEIGDLVEWGFLTIHPNDCATVFQWWDKSKRLDNMFVSNETTIVKHTGIVSFVGQYHITILDFTNRTEDDCPIEWANNNLTILNKK
jgi:hypothetical protein